MLEIKILHCHLVATRPCQPGLTHQGFLHLTKSIYFSSIEGDISRRGLSDIHSFWIEKIVMSVDHGWNQARENEASGKKHTWLLASIWIYLYVFNLETNHFWTKKCSKAVSSALNAESKLISHALIDSHSKESWVWISYTFTTMYKSFQSETVMRSPQSYLTQFKTRD